MMRVGRIMRDYTEAGAVNAQIALWGFVDEHTFLTKAGHVGLVYRLRGRDAEGLTHDQRRAFCHQMEAALRLLDDRWRLYQYVLKTEARSIVAPTCSRPVGDGAKRVVVMSVSFARALPQAGELVHTGREPQQGNAMPIDWTMLRTIVP